MATSISKERIVECLSKIDSNIYFDGPSVFVLHGDDKRPYSIKSFPRKNGIMVFVYQSDKRHHIPRKVFQVKKEELSQRNN